MKLTSKKLKQIIREELGKTLKETYGDRPMGSGSQLGGLSYINSKNNDGDGEDPIADPDELEWAREVIKNPREYSKEEYKEAYEIAYATGENPDAYSGDREPDYDDFY